MSHGILAPTELMQSTHDSMENALLICFYGSCEQNNLYKVSRHHLFEAGQQQFRTPTITIKPSNLALSSF